ncbi:MAG: sulfotransferase [Sphingomonas bacterium]
MASIVSRSDEAVLDEARRLVGSDPAAAAALLEPLLQKLPDHAPMLRLLALALRSQGQAERAATVELLAIEASSRHPRLMAAIRDLASGRMPSAEAAVRAFLRRDPDDVAALCVLADIAGQSGIYGEAEKLYRKAIDSAPDFAEARVKLAQILLLQNRPADALALLDEVLLRAPLLAPAYSSRLAILGRTGAYQTALESYAELLTRLPDDFTLWLGLANVLKTVGRRDACIAAYRQSIALDPHPGESWWGLANLKTAPFNMADIAAMKATLAKADTPPIQVVNLHFALGKALGDDGDYAASFHHYQTGNQLQRGALRYDPDEITREVQRSIALFSRAFFEERTDFGEVASDPIFIVGMPRAGSTLIEQILASHSQVEGTSELPDIPLVVHWLLSETWRDGNAVYPELLTRLTKAASLYLGQHYLAGAETHRKSERPYFIDKLPDNWAHVGLIHLILPGARIIDIRRDATACCFASYKQHFAVGHEFSYDLTDMARHYRDYVALMDHMDAALPGRIIRIHYEDLVADPERTVRTLLDQLDLPFEDNCLRFHENTRPIRTASAEQVRRPINRDTIDQWRNYEPWLGELTQAFGPLAPK